MSTIIIITKPPTAQKASSEAAKLEQLQKDIKALEDAGFVVQQFDTK